MIWSLGWRSRLIIPRELWKSLAERQRSTLVVHELAHLRRGDHRANLRGRRDGPLLVASGRLVGSPCALGCRGTVLRCLGRAGFPDAARSYAETLLEAIDFLNGSEKAEPLLASGFGKVSHLPRRLTMILTGSSSRLMGVRGGRD